MTPRTEFLIVLCAVLFALCAALYTDSLVGRPAKDICPEWSICKEAPADCIDNGLTKGVVCGKETK